MNGEKAEFANTPRGHPPSLQTKVTTIHARGSGCTNFIIMVEPGFGEEVSSIYKDLLEDPAIHWNGRELYTTCERHPDVQKLYAAGGKARAFAQSKIQSAGAKAECSRGPR
eukprot:4705751-Pyramimonas_sp.AAC.1